MRVLTATSAIYRPHIFGPNCWCKPEACEDCGRLTVHHLLEVAPDRQHRMAVFSDPPIRIPV